MVQQCFIVWVLACIHAIARCACMCCCLFTTHGFIVLPSTLGGCTMQYPDVATKFTFAFCCLFVAHGAVAVDNVGQSVSEKCWLAMVCCRKWGIRRARNCYFVYCQPPNRHHHCHSHHSPNTKSRL